MTFCDTKFATIRLLSIVVICTTIALFPIENSLATIASMLVIWWVSAALYRQTPHKNIAGLYTLSTIWTVLCVGVSLNIYRFTTVLGGTDSSPILLNPDAYLSWNYAMHYLGRTPEGMEIIPHMRGYGHFLSFILRLTGISLTAGLMVNVFATMITIIASGVISSRLLRGMTPWSDSKVATCAMIMTGSVCYLTASGALLIKDALVIMSMSLIAMGLTAVRKMPEKRAYKVILIGAYLVGLAILFFLRHQYIIMSAVGLIFMARRDKTALKTAVPLMIITIIVFAGAYQYISTSQIESVVTGTGNSISFSEPNQVAYGNIVGNYMEWPYWKKAVWLPISAVLQFFIPFPWNFTKSIDWGYTQALSRIAFPWYLIGGLVIYFWLFTSLKAPRRLQLWTLCATLMWLVPAFLFGGTISRYGLPLIPSLIPAAVYVIAKYRQLKLFKLYTVVFSILVLSVLCIAHNLQEST